MRRAEELADTFEAALAAHVPASQTAEWEGWEAYLGLVALAEAGERYWEALRQIAAYEWMVGNEDVEMGDLYRAVCDVVRLSRAALGEGS